MTPTLATNETNCYVLALYPHSRSPKQLFQWRRRTTERAGKMDRDRIQHAIDTIYGKIFNQGQGDLYPGMVSGPYIQHNPLFQNGLDAILGYIKQAGRIPCEVKRVAIDGDLAFVHVRYLDWGGQETAGVDIFRFNADGKVVEHWDVLQPVPASSNNANTMF
jgi:predicted SnoaL-like aldol condensation-catalyzing enzyme